MEIRILNTSIFVWLPTSVGRKNCFFVDLFVRVSNKVAVDMYHNLGYSVYRKVLEYYSGEVDEDAFGNILHW